MSSQTLPPTIAEEPGVPFLKWLAAQRAAVPYGFLGLAALFAITAVICLVKRNGIDSPLDPRAEAYLHVIIYMGILSIAALVTGVVMMVRPPAPGEEISRIRLEMLIAGTVIGGWMVLWGIRILLFYRDILLTWLRTGTRDQLWVVILNGALVIVGLAITFASVQLARSQERNNPAMRKLLYGYSTVINSFLLLIILIILNVVVFLKMPAELDATNAAFSVMSDSSIELISAIKEPVKAYMIMPEDGPPLNRYINTQRLLANASAINSNFSYETFSPELNDKQIRELFTKFGTVQRNQYGLILVVGAKDPQVSFIPSSELATSVPTGNPEDPRPPKLVFQGESKLVNELRFLTDAKTKPVVYFTTGHRELNVIPAGPQGGNEDSASQLYDYLQKRRIEVRSLNFDPLAATPTTIPDDATIVVIAGPKQKLSAGTVEALQQYLNRPGSKGKLFALLDALPGTGDPKVAPTGLEPLLETYGVDLKTRMLNAVNQNEEISKSVPATVSIGAVRARNRLATAFLQRVFLFNYTRPVSPTETPNPAYRVDELLVSLEGVPTWFETEDRNITLAELAKESRIPERQRELRISREPIPVAVLVSEGGTDPQDAADAKARMAIFGTSQFLRDSFASERGSAPQYFELFAGTIDWLRDRPAAIAVEPKTYEFFTLPPGISQLNLLWLPLLLVASLILMAGLGVWLVRRR